MTTKPPVTVRYAEPDYWDARYQREPALFEWFFGHTALRRIVRAFISKKKPVLHVGCGTSNLQEGMARSGYNIINTDISDVVIKQMQQRHAQYSNMTYMLSDCRNMPEFLDCQFGHVIDKGTMDALLCCKQGTDNVMRMLLEIHRVLQPGGSFLLVTLGDPDRRLPLLLDPRLQWKVSLLLLPKISAANQAYVDGKPINDSTQPVDALGPFDVVDDETVVGLPAGVQYSNFFFAYVCKKPPLQLPQGDGQRSQLPDGWVAGSKELFQKLQKELGLPEDLLSKGRRKRVIHVPAGTAASMHGLQLPPTNGRHSGYSSAASSAQGSCSTHMATAGSQKLHAQELQLALSSLEFERLQLEQQQPQQLPLKASSRTEGRVRTDELPARPQSAPNLAALGAVSASQSAAAAVMPSLPAAAAAAAVGATSASQGRLPTDVTVYELQQSSPACVSNNSSSSSIGIHPVSAAACLQDAPPVAALAPAGVDDVQYVPAAAVQQLQSKQQVHNFCRATVSSPGSSGQAALQSAPRFVRYGASRPSQQHSISEDDAATAPAVAAVAGGNSTSAVFVGDAGTGIPPSSQPSALTDGQLKSLQARSLSTLSPTRLAAAGAAGEVLHAGPHAHSALPLGMGRAPRLRRFSTEYGALYGTALQPQLAQLRLLQAQHSERAADGLVLHDVAANDACSSAAAAAAVAAAAWGNVRPRRDRRLSNLSILSSLSMLSSTNSIDESGEDAVEAESTGMVATAACSAEASAVLCTDAHTGGAPAAAGAVARTGAEAEATTGPVSETSGQAAVPCSGTLCSPQSPQSQLCQVSSQDNSPRASPTAAVHAQ